MNFFNHDFSTHHADSTINSAGYFILEHNESEFGIARNTIGVQLRDSPLSDLPKTKAPSCVPYNRGQITSSWLFSYSFLPGRQSTLKSTDGLFSSYYSRDWACMTTGLGFDLIGFATLWARVGKTFRLEKREPSWWKIWNASSLSSDTARKIDVSITVSEKNGVAFYQKLSSTTKGTAEMKTSLTENYVSGRKPEKLVEARNIQLPKRRKLKSG